MIRYDRQPSAALRSLLTPSGFLAPLLAPRSVLGHLLDVHLRNDHVHVYCGGTRLLDAWPARGGVRVDADDSYKNQACGADLFRPWAPVDSGFDDALDAYYGGVTLGSKWTVGEGAVQAAWAAIRDPWVSFDREAVLGYESAAARTAACTFPAVAAAWAELDVVRLAGGSTAPKKNAGAEVDQLAIDREGRLVLIELKDATASDVPTSPLQLLQYVHEWAAAFETVRPGIAALCDARIALGLAPASLPRLKEGLRPVIGFGADVRRPEVRAHFNTALEIVNRHLPPGASSMEAWATSESQLVRLN